MSFEYPREFDVVVIGAGHAGIEAAYAAARVGGSVAVLTQNLDTIGQMSCNPAVGGLGKGQMVREIDALDGFMALNTDATGIQFRLLNSSKGPSVRAPRAQCDKKAYQFRAKVFLERLAGVQLFQGNATTILTSGEKACGVQTNLGLVLRARSVVVTTGTFMRGLLHVGLENQSGGRMGDASSTLSGSLLELGFAVERFKTGTPCRINGRSIDYCKCEVQPGDPIIQRFSFLQNEPRCTSGETFTYNVVKDGVFHVEQAPCWITYTTPRTHDIIRANLDKSPMYTGRIEGIGPRYCPSIEDKVVRFADKDRHQIFLEPEGRHSNEYYVNGVSTSLPMSVQFDFIRSIPGLESAEIVRPGYAVEYDYCPPTQLHSSLETKLIAGLYFAGQINGTSGYEEAAAQGLVAGANAALKLNDSKPFIPTRESSYIGVMIDDLVTKGVSEPYRMFTSRAERRLSLRYDTADLRLTPAGSELGFVSPTRSRIVQEKQVALTALAALADSARESGISVRHYLRQPGNSWRNLPNQIRSQFPAEIWSVFENDVRYEGYIRREQDNFGRLEKLNSTPIPSDLDFNSLAGLRMEAKQKLQAIRPKDLGQASRISGLTPADISVLAIELRRSPSRS
jgi:tRNA uridine 5-carboxymethylaminomethyl modification enzyme